MIDQIIPVHNFYKDIYEEKINNGKKYLLDQKIVVLCLCRNASRYIEKNIASIIDLLNNRCKDYKIVIFENDSSDNTKDILNNLSENNNKIHVISENFNRPHFGSVKDINRTTALAEYRNILKNYVKNNLSDYHFTIVMDTDFKEFSSNGIFNSFGWFKEYEILGAMCGNSFEIKDFMNFGSPSLWNYDCWAFRGTWWHDWQMVKLGEYQNYNPMIWFGMWILPPGSQPIRINSGFGGTCIYKTTFFITGEYDGTDCEHVSLHYNLYQKNPKFNLMLNPSQMMLLN